MDSIKIDTCDGCSGKRSVRVFHSMGVPVLSLCRTCDPRAYDSLQRRSPAVVTARRTTARKTIRV